MVQAELLDECLERPLKNNAGFSYIRSVVKQLSALDVLQRPDALCMAVACIVKRDQPQYDVKVMTSRCQMSGCQQKYGRVENVVVVTLPNQQRIYVDPEWRRRFYVLRRTAEFDVFLSTLPQVFVGSELMLKQHIFRNCHEMNQCLESLDMSVPPWRTAGVMLVWYASLQSLAIDIGELVQSTEMDLSLMDVFQVDMSLPFKSDSDEKSSCDDSGSEDNNDFFEKEPVPAAECHETPSLLSKILKADRSVPICYGTRDAWPINWGWGSFGSTMIM
eukprot:EG_transcript_9784